MRRLLHLGIHSWSLEMSGAEMALSEMALNGAEMVEAEVDEDFTWKIELETALFEEAEIGTLRNIARGRPIPQHLRLDFWKVCQHTMVLSY